MHINDLLKTATDQGASDLHLKVGSHPVVRINGKLHSLTDHKRLMQEDTIAMAFSIMSARQKQKFKDHFELDLAYSVPGLGRFRVNAFQQRGTVGLVVRAIPVRIATISELRLPPVLELIGGSDVRGLAHITGGGVLENLPRVLPEGCGARIRAGSWPAPPVFGFLARGGDVPEGEMYRVFNMGLGMLAVVSAADADGVPGSLAGHAVHRVGEIVAGDRAVVIE